MNKKMNHQSHLLKSHYNAFTRMGLYEEEGIRKETRTLSIDDMVIDLQIDIEHLIELLVDVELSHKKNQQLQTKVNKFIPVKTLKDTSFTYINSLEFKLKLDHLFNLCDDFGNLLYSLGEDASTEGDSYIETHINNFLRSPTRYAHFIKGQLITALNEYDRLTIQITFLEDLLTTLPMPKLDGYNESDFCDPECCLCESVLLDDEVDELPMNTTFFGKLVKTFEMETIQEETEPNRYNTRSHTKRTRKSIPITPTPKSAFKTI